MQNRTVVVQRKGESHRAANVRSRIDEMPSRLGWRAWHAQTLGACPRRSSQRSGGSTTLLRTRCWPSVPISASQHVMPHDQGMPCTLQALRIQGRHLQFEVVVAAHAAELVVVAAPDDVRQLQVREWKRLKPIGGVSGCWYPWRSGGPESLPFAPGAFAAAPC